MKIFVTGATGFIGSHFLNHAMRAGHEIVAQRRSLSSRPRIRLISEPRWVDAQLDDVSEGDLKHCDVVVHLAAHTPNVPYDTLENCIRWNVLAPLRLFRAAMSAGIDRFVVAGSCFEYGASGERYDFIPPDAPLMPTQTYPASKAAASIAFMQLAIEYKLRLSIHRIFQVYGEGESENRLWPSLRRAAVQGEDFPMTLGEQVRDFIPAESVAHCLLMHATELEVKAGVPVVTNIGTGCPESLLQFATRWWREFGASGKLLVGSVPYRANEVMRYVPRV